MRKIGDVLFIKFGNQYDRQKCKIIGIKKILGDTKFDIELIEPQFNWKTGNRDLKLKFSNIHYCNLKENM